MKLLRQLVIIVGLILLNACSKSGTPLTVLSGSELKDIKPLLPEIESCSGTSLNFSYIGTLDGAEQLAGGGKYDIAWFSHGKYLSLLMGTGSRIVTQEKIMLSPVVLGIKTSKARQWGWVDKTDLTWNDIAEKAAAKELTFAMTNPASSNSGFTALIGVAAALSGSTGSFDMEKLNRPALKKFFQGQTLTAGSSGWLADTYVKEQDRIDGIINYESVLLQLNASGKLRDQLTLIYPQEGIITADYPIMLLEKSKREVFDKLVQCLRQPELQTKIMQQTQRRPIVPQVKPDARFPKNILVELPFPRTIEEVDSLLFIYLDEIRKPSYTVFVLDTSGSMQGQRIGELKRALSNLTGTDTSITGQFARFRQNETVVMLPFNSKPQPETVFKISNTKSSGEDMQKLRNYIDQLSARGGTAIYSSLQRAFELVAQAKKDNPDWFYSIVLLSDGDNTQGMKFNQFRASFGAIVGDAEGTKVFPILFGSSNEDEMSGLNSLTGGRSFDGHKYALNVVFKSIRGYQ